MLVMEYLSKCFASKLPRTFEFHPGCQGMKLSHLVFVDDLFIFCGGKEETVKDVANILHYFSKVSGLQVNDSKSVAFFSCIEEEEKKKILYFQQFQEAQLPAFKREHCLALLQKILARITCLSVRNLLYEGRVQLVNLVLRSLHVYLCSVFVMPTSVLKEFDKFYKNFFYGLEREM